MLTEIRSLSFNCETGIKLRAPLLDPGQIIIWIRTCRGLVGGEGTSRVHIMAIDSQLRIITKKPFRYKDDYLNIISSSITRKVASRFRLYLLMIFYHDLIVHQI